MGAKRHQSLVLINLLLIDICKKNMNIFFLLKCDLSCPFIFYFKRILSNKMKNCQSIFYKNLHTLTL